MYASLDFSKRAYWVYRYRLNSRDRETSVGPIRPRRWPTPRSKHRQQLVASVRQQGRPSGRPARRQGSQDREATTRPLAKSPTPISTRKEKRGEAGQVKHRAQWYSTLASLHPALVPFAAGRLVGPQQVFETLDERWAETPGNGPTVARQDRGGALRASQKTRAPTRRPSPGLVEDLASSARRRSSARSTPRAASGSSAYTSRRWTSMVTAVHRAAERDRRPRDQERLDSPSLAPRAARNEGARRTVGRDQLQQKRCGRFPPERMKSSEVHENPAIQRRAQYPQCPAVRGAATISRMCSPVVSQKCGR